MEDRRILLIDSDPETSSVISLFLQEAGARVYLAQTGAEGLGLMAEAAPDLVILDVTLPDLTGWQVCQHIRQYSFVPMMMLTDLSEDHDMIKGLAYGADDYLTKPVNLEVLLARIEALLRRAALPAATMLPDTYQDKYLNIDLKKRSVSVTEQAVTLSKQEFALLAYLVRRPNQLCSFEQILAAVWGPYTDGNPQYVHVYISRLRRKLERTAEIQGYFQTEYRRGYRFVPKSDAS